jgi:hypothetical protein
MTAPELVDVAAVLFEKVFTPASVCAPVVITPPFVPSAGVKVIVVPLIVAPFALDVPAIEATVFTPAIMEVVVALVILPFESMVKEGIAVDEP